MLPRSRKVTQSMVCFALKQLDLYQQSLVIKLLQLFQQC